jgi:hypothetical protein
LAGLRKEFWKDTQADDRVRFENIILERPPLGSVFTSDGGYITPDGAKVSHSMRQYVYTLQQRYKTIQEAYLEQARKLQQQQAKE